MNGKWEAKALLVGLLGLGIIAGTGSAQGAGLLIADGGLGGVLTIKEHDVKVTINNGVAVTEVNQVFVNTENRQVEALYTFPVPKGASVSNFSMWIGGKEMVGEVVEKKRAREIYNSYKQVRRDPGLLEQVDYKRFEMRIFPIAAGAEQRVQIIYYQELDVDHDWANYVYPLATVTQTNIDQKTQGKFAITLDVKSEVPIEELSSTSHGKEFVVAEHGANYRRASLETRDGDLSRDVVLGYRTARPVTGFDLITSKQSGEDGYFQLSLTAGKELEQLNQGMDYVFILDISGSMAYDGKLATSREAVEAFVAGLGTDDRFEVITFNISPAPLFSELTKVDDASRKRAAEFLVSKQAAGGTVLRPALTAAYRYRTTDRPLNVVLLSDGMTEQTEQAELVQLISQRPGNCRVFCIGVGNEVNRPLLSQLAGDAGGLSAFISQGDDFQRQAKAFRRKLIHPALANVRIEFPNGRVYDTEPEKLPSLYHGSPLRIYGRYRDSGPATVTLHGEINGAPIKQEIQVELPARDDRNPEIERMWAWHRVDRLLGDARRGGESASQLNEVVRLCEGYSIASEYASFIVLENDGEYQRWKIERRNATRIQRDRAAQTRLREELDRKRAESLAKLGPKDGAETQVAAANPATPQAQPVPQAAPQNQFTPSTPAPNFAPPASPRRRGFDVNLGGGHGGGAIDPITGMIVIGMAGAAAATRLRK